MTVVFIALGILFFPKEVKSVDPVPPPPVPTISYAQNVWKNALEWCESRGVPSAVNKVDRDGTASYYSFQFKPSTFRAYGEMYEVIPKDLTDEEVHELMASSTMQHKVVDQMILHYKDINWRQQFPDCINNKIGMPPRY